jgi:hypothetical protein
MREPAGAAIGLHRKEITDQVGSPGGLRQNAQGRLTEMRSILPKDLSEVGDAPDANLVDAVRPRPRPLLGLMHAGRDSLFLRRVR